MELRTKERWRETIPDANDAPEDTARWTAAPRTPLGGNDIDDLDDGSLDLLERGALALVGAIHTERLRRQAWEVRDWGTAAPAELVDSSPTWRGHPDALVHPEREYPLFCAEPYELGSANLLALAELAVAGWDVRVDAGSAVHFPVRTLRSASPARAVPPPRRGSAGTGRRSPIPVPIRPGAGPHPPLPPGRPAAQPLRRFRRGRRLRRRCHRLGQLRHGDERLIRLGYLAQLTLGVGPVEVQPVLRLARDGRQRAWAEGWYVRPLEEILDRRASVAEFLPDLGREALALARAPEAPERVAWP